jgi:hypothetical protein
MILSPMVSHISPLAVALQIAYIYVDGRKNVGIRRFPTNLYSFASLVLTRIA